MVCMALHGKKMRPWLIISRILLFTKTLRASSTLLLWRNDIRKFDADAILYRNTRCNKIDISMFLAVFSLRFWLKSGKICKNRSTFFIFTFFAKIPCFFSRARSAPREGGTGKYWPPYQPPYQPSTRVLDSRAGQLYLTWSIWLGQKSSIKGNTSISIW